MTTTRRLYAHTRIPCACTEDETRRIRDDWYRADEGEGYAGPEPDWCHGDHPYCAQCNERLSDRPWRYADACLELVEIGSERGVPALYSHLFCDVDCLRAWYADGEDAREIGALSCDPGCTVAWDPRPLRPITVKPRPVAAPDISF